MVDTYAAAPAGFDLRTEAIAGATLLLAPRIPASFFNRAIGLGVFEPASERALDEILERCESAKPREFWLHLNPVAKPAQLAGLARGTRPRAAASPNVGQVSTRPRALLGTAEHALRARR